MKILVLTTPTCIKCKSYTKELLEKCNEYTIEIKDAMSPENAHLIKEYQLTSVPFTLVYDSDGNVIYHSRSITHADEILLELKKF